MDQQYFKSLYESKELADCSFVFPNEENKIIQGHVVVLSSASLIFRSMFLDLTKATSQPNEGSIRHSIIVRNVTSSAFKALLRFIYCRDRIRTNVFDLVNLYDAFDKYDCKDGKAFIIQQILKPEISSSGCVKLLQLAKNINDDLLFKVCVKTLFENRYDPEVANNISPELLKDALCYLIITNEGNNRVSSENIASIVMKYISVNQNRFSNLHETLLPILEALKWNTVPLTEITKCPILNNRQKMEFIKRHLKANDSASESDMEASDVEMKPVSKKRKRHCQEIMLNQIGTRIGQLYIEQKHTDCEFVFSNGESLKAHKLVLCFSSLVFETMFYGTVGQTGPVEIENTKKSVFELLLKILYLLDVDLSSESSETLADLYTAAFKHQCIRALDTIREYISVRSADAFLFFGLSKKYVDEKLKKICLKFFQNPLAALKTNHFLNSDLETVCLVYKENKVNGSGMIDLVKGLELYIEKNKDEHPQIMIEVQEALKGIKFLKLKTFEILETILLSEREKWILFAIKQDFKMQVEPPIPSEIKRLSVYDSRVIHKNMISGFSTWSWKSTVVTKHIIGVPKRSEVLTRSKLSPAVNN